MLSRIVLVTVALALVGVNAAGARDKMTCYKAMVAEDFVEQVLADSRKTALDDIIAKIELEPKKSHRPITQKFENESTPESKDPSNNFGLEESVFQQWRAERQYEISREIIKAQEDIIKDQETHTLQFLGIAPLLQSIVLSLYDDWRELPPDEQASFVGYFVRYIWSRVMFDFGISGSVSLPYVYRTESDFVQRLVNLVEEKRREIANLESDWVDVTKVRYVLCAQESGTLLAQPI